MLYLANLLAIWSMGQELQLGTWQKGRLILSSALSFLAFARLPFPAGSFALSLSRFSESLITNLSTVTAYSQL